MQSHKWWFFLYNHDQYSYDIEASANQAKDVTAEKKNKVHMSTVLTQVGVNMGD